MKKLVFAIMALASIALFGCDRRSEEQKKCEEFVKSNLKTPGSYKFISFQEDDKFTYKDSIDSAIVFIEDVISIEKETMEECYTERCKAETMAYIEICEKRIDSLKSLFETEKEKLNNVLYTFYSLDYYAKNVYNAEIKSTAKFIIIPDGNIVCYCMDDCEDYGKNWFCNDGDKWVEMNKEE